ncbi:DNA-binding protein [Bacteroidia bacterium]|nr:DNA-binding protein [Bacteroidia bacterium]GHT77975.1 DNA-binding protein [Bacteroidia bacterium]
MGFKYRVKTKTDNINKGKEPKYYAVPVSSGELDLRHLSDLLVARSALSRSDVVATIVGLTEVLEESLHNGHSVRIDGLGIFTLSASSKGYDNPADCTPHRVQARKICFRADNALKKNLKFVKFERDK